MAETYWPSSANKHIFEHPSLLSMYKRMLQQSAQPLSQNKKFGTYRIKVNSFFQHDMYGFIAGLETFIYIPILGVRAAKAGTSLCFLHSLVSAFTARI